MRAGRKDAMEQALTPDRFFGQEDEAKPRREQEDAGTNKVQPLGGSGATDIFGVMPPATESAGAAPPASEAATRGPLPVVHSVVFKAGSSRKEETDQLLNLLRSSPAPAASTQPAAPAPLPLAPSSGGFTQLLRALNYDQVKEQARAEPPKAEPMRAVEFSAVSVQETPPVPQAPPVSPAIAAVSSGLSAPQTVIPLMPQVTSFQPQANSVQPQAPPSQPQAPAGSFAQLFQGVESQQKESTKREEVSAVPTPGSFTQIFEAATPEPVRARDIVESTPVMEPTPAVPVAGPAAPGSFTQMFQALGATLPAPMMIDSAVAAAGAGAPSGVTAEPYPAPVSGTDRTTQVFSTLPASSVKVAPVEPVPPAVHSPGSFTQMFQAVSAPPVEAAKVEAAPAAAAAVTVPATAQPVALVPGSFTQMFRTLDATPVEAVKVEQPSAVSPSPGSFTQMFQAVSPQPVEVAKVEAAAAIAVRVAQPQASGPGSFTQMFRALDAAPAGSEPAAPLAGSFTQLFGVGGTPSSAEAPKERGGEIAPPYSSHGQPAHVSGESGASQMFSVYRPIAEPTPEPVQPPLARPPQAAASSGGLTQLLRALDQPQQAAPRPSAAPAAGPPAAGPPAAGQQPGAFTAMYGTLQGGGSAPPASPPPVFPQPISPQPVLPQQGSAPVTSGGQDATHAFRLPQAAAAPLAPPVQAGPSEFTRILNASVLREAALRGSAATPAAGEGVSPGAPAGPAGPAAAPWAMPAAPKAPEAPKLPQLKLPEAPKAAAPAAGKMQQFLPLLLILIIFLLLAILVAVIFLMKK